MDSIWLAAGALVTALGAVIGSIVNGRIERGKARVAEARLAIERSKSSGQVSTTDADGLWKEAGDLRRQYQTEIAELRRALESSSLEHHRERTELLEQLQSLRLELRAKDDRIEHLERENATLTGRVGELEQELRKRLEAAHRAASSMPAEGGAT